MINETHWYQMPIEDVFRKLETNDSGLTSSVALDRLKKFGANELKSRKPSILMRFLRQFNNPLIYILLAAAAITAT